MKINDARTLPPEAQEDICRKAVKACLEGRKKTEVAEIFGVTRQAVTKWVKRFQEGGEKTLQTRRRGRRKVGRKFLPWQAAQTARMVMDRHSEQLKLPFYLWTRQAVVDLVMRKYGVTLSVWTIGRYLKVWGLTPRRYAEPMSRTRKRWISG